MKRVVGYPLPLGVSENNGNMNFSFEVEKDKMCKLCFFEKGEELPIFELELGEEDAVGNVRFAAFSQKDVEGLEYGYQVENEFVIDPYTRKVANSNYGKRGVVCVSDYDWEGDKPLAIPYHQVIAYNLHVKGFTKHKSSKVENQGTFAGVVEKIPYLLELGVNQIQCMPIYDFNEGEAYTNYWGYGEGQFFSVKETYASSTSPETELKDMVKACHKAGIEVVLNLPFTNNTPKQMMVACLQYYVMEYHIDGFVLNGYYAPLDQIYANPLLKGVKILENKDDFQNTMRRFLKGDEGMVSSVMWWLSKGSLETGSFNYITNHTGFTLHDLVSYNEKHNEENGEENKDGPDNNYSWNCGEEGPSRKKVVQELRKRQMRNAMFLLMMAQGTPCILAGDEFGNSQKGNNNVYCQDNDLAWLNWKDLEKREDFFEYVKKLIQIRKEYPILHADRALKGTDQIGYGVPDISFHGETAWRVSVDNNSRQLGIYYHDEDGTDIYLGYNMNYVAQKLALPTLAKEKKWYMILSTAADVISNVVLEKQILLDPRTIVMFVGR